MNDSGLDAHGLRHEAGYIRHLDMTDENGRVANSPPFCLPLLTSLMLSAYRNKN